MLIFAWDFSESEQDKYLEWIIMTVTFFRAISLMISSTFFNDHVHGPILLLMKQSYQFLFFSNWINSPHKTFEQSKSISVQESRRHASSTSELIKVDWWMLSPKQTLNSTSDTSFERYLSMPLWRHAFLQSKSENSWLSLTEPRSGATCVKGCLASYLWQTS